MGDRKVLRVYYFKKKNKVYANYFIVNEQQVEFLLNYFAETEKFWRRENGTYGSKCMWQRRKKKSKKSKKYANNRFSAPPVYYFHPQPLGIKWFYKYPKTIAKWLGKEKPEQFSGHSVARTALTHYANLGASVAQIKQFGNWKSMTVAAMYHAQSVPSKLHAAKSIESLLGSTVGRSGNTDFKLHHAMKALNAQASNLNISKFCILFF